MIGDIKRSTERVGLEIRPGQNKNSQQSRIEQKNGGDDRQHQSGSVLPARECAKYLGQTITFRTARNNRNKESNQSCLGDIYQAQTRIDIDIIPPTSQTPLIQHGHYPYADVRLWNMDTLNKNMRN